MTSPSAFVKVVPWAAIAVLALAVPAPCIAAPPRPDHVVVVIEENHSFESVIGSPSAPYINQLAQQGVLLSSMFALAHPSQPNYLEFFSGSNQGVFNNAEQTSIPWSTPNLGASLRSVGASFIGFSEDLPTEGSLIWESGSYARRHVPWTNWQASAPGINQLPPFSSQPFSQFPTDFTTLPAVSFVVPNNQHNMHDGTIAQADAWLQSYLQAYSQWALLHNSLLVVVWDEDDFSHRNHIPCILYGPMVRPGAFDGVLTLHDLHRAIADMFAAPPTGQAANVRGILGVWSTDPPVRSVKFQQGIAAYSSTADTYIEQAAPTTAHATDARLVADGSPLSQALLRFSNVFGTGPGRVPVNATILSARVAILTSAAAGDISANTMGLHRMLAPWSDAATWDSLSAGISTDNIECAATPDFSLAPWLADARSVFDVTSTVQAWSASPDPNAANLGWAIVPTGTDGWRPSSAETPVPEERPLLEITYVLPPCPPDINNSGTLTVQDIFDFLAAWFAGNPAANFNGAGATDVQDIFDFLAAWFAGC